jgi:hypothetical protein
VWGSEADPSFVSVREGGQPSSSRLPVTPNLYDAIRYLRKEDEVRIVWIDAVCINQKDLAERSVEVGRMGDIFRNAIRVVIWLGPESSSSGVAVYLINAMAADLMAAETPGDEFTVLPGSETANLLSNLDDLRPKVKALNRLCQRQWFTRLWIYQEYHLSTVAIAIIGRTAFNMRDLYKVLRFIRVGEVQAGVLREQVLYSSELSFAAQVLKPIKETSPPLSLMKNLRHSTCSDERDRVYAILGLISTKYRAAIVPDYTKSLQEVNKEFFLSTLQMQSTIRIPEDLEEQCESTSWLPKSAKTLQNLDMCFASGRSHHEIVYERSNESLRLPAKAIGTIRAIWFSVPDRHFTHDTLGLCRAHTRPETRDEAYHLGGNILDAYICSLAGGQWWEIMDLAWAPTLQELRDILQSGDISKETMAKAKWFKAINRGALFSTFEGFIGLYPSSGKVGDQIYVTPGVKTAILVSAVEDRPNYFRVKGECYVHGLMNSEALLGPLLEFALGSVWGYQFTHIQGVYEVVFTNGEVKT